MNTLTITSRKLLVSVLMVGVLLCGVQIPKVSAAAIGVSNNIELTGYMWSSTIGWISLNCKTGGLDGPDAGTVGDDICATSNYRVIMNTVGNLYGWAWSSNIGWIKFGSMGPLLSAQGLTFPAGAGTTAADANVDGTYPVLTFDGWARACAGTQSATGQCSNMASRTDGWDGWISLKGTGYSLTTAAGGGVAALGYFWGDDVTGWIGSTASMGWNEMKGVLTGNPCTIDRGNSTCATTVTWLLTPATIYKPIVEQKTPANVTTQINGVGVSGSLPVNLSYGNTVYTAKSDTVQLDTLTLNAVCTNPEDTIVAGKCNFDTTLPVVITLTAKNKFVRSGGSVDLDWTITGTEDQTGCMLTGPKVSGNPINALTGTTKVSGLTSYSTFTLSCTRTGGSGSATANVEVIPTVTEN